MTIRLLPALIVSLALIAPAHAVPAVDGGSYACAGMADKRARKAVPGRPKARCGAELQEAP